MRASNDKETHQTKEETTKLPSLYRGTIGMAGKNEPSPLAPERQTMTQMLWTVQDNSHNQPLRIPPKPTDSVEDPQCLPRITPIPIY
jgi:hypothetical protein